jgi:hypothetical protein
VNKAILSTVLFFASAATVIAQDTSQKTTSALTLSVTDAKILLYLSPAAKAVRKTGFDVALELQTSEAHNKTDYYVFYMFNSKRKCEGCSPTIGYYAVNKHTADIRDLNQGDEAPFVRDAELQGIQELVRNDYYMSSEVLKQYRLRPLSSVQQH